LSSQTRSRAGLVRLSPCPPSPARSGSLRPSDGRDIWRGGSGPHLAPRHCGSWTLPGGLRNKPRSGTGRIPKDERRSPGASSPRCSTPVLERWSWPPLAGTPPHRRPGPRCGRGGGPSASRTLWGPPPRAEPGTTQVLLEELPGELADMATSMKRWSCLMFFRLVMANSTSCVVRRPSWISCRPHEMDDRATPVSCSASSSASPLVRAAAILHLSGSVGS